MDLGAFRIARCLSQRRLTWDYTLKSGVQDKKMLALDVIRRLEVPEVTLLLHPQRLCAGQTGLFPQQCERLRADLNVAKRLRVFQLIDANVKARSVLFSDEWLEPSRHRLPTRHRSTR